MGHVEKGLKNVADMEVHMYCDVNIQGQGISKATIYNGLCSTTSNENDAITTCHSFISEWITKLPWDTVYRSLGTRKRDDIWYMREIRY